MATEKKIRVNVGGVCYETTSSTLLSINGDKSYFSLFLSNLKNEGIETNVQGEIFIDRNGMLFQYILDYLRTGSTATVPNKIHIIKGLIIEADYYMLDDLSSILSKKLEIEQMNHLNMNMNMMYIQNMNSGENKASNAYKKTNEYTHVYLPLPNDFCDINDRKEKGADQNLGKLDYEFSLNEDF